MTFNKWILVSLVVLAIAIRVWWLLIYGEVIENEGSEYARLAQNLLNGNGYEGAE